MTNQDEVREVIDRAFQEIVWLSVRKDYDLAHLHRDDDGIWVAIFEAPKKRLIMRLRQTSWGICCLGILEE